MKFKFSSFAVLACASVCMFSCKKNSDSPSIPAYTAPTTYNFSTASYTNQKILFAMADQLGAQINLANAVPAKAVSLQTLTNMFNNTGSPFVDSAAYSLNNSGLSLASLCPTAVKTDLLNYLDSVAVFSQSTATASQGVAGVAVSNASKKLLLSGNGIFYSQVVKKILMGLFSYQIANVYLKDSIPGTTDTTKLNHYWDAAFGFFGVPTNFPTVTTGSKYLGSYCNQVNNGLGSNARIMNAFLLGRAAIGVQDYATVQAQAKYLIKVFDTLNAACIVQEMNETYANVNGTAGVDAVASYGTLSESLGMVFSFKYNTGTRAITSAQIASLLALYDTTNGSNPNLYNFIGFSQGLSTTQVNDKLNKIASFIASIYGFNAAQIQLGGTGTL